MSDATQTPDTAAIVAETREQIAALHEWRDEEPAATTPVPGYPAFVESVEYRIDGNIVSEAEWNAAWFPGATDAEPPLERLRRLTGDCDTADLWRDTGFETPTDGD
jgi:hypothetical protein